MTMMSSIQCNPIFKTTYERLLAIGKPKNAYRCLHEKDGCDTKSSAKRRYNVE